MSWGNNMAIFNANALAIIGTDTSKDTVTAETLLQGYTAHDKNGQQVVGTHVCRTGILQEKTITKNGEFAPDEGYTGFSKVTVIVDTTNDYLVQATAKKINPPTVQAVSSFNKNTFMRSYTVTATIGTLE